MIEPPESDKAEGAPAKPILSGLAEAEKENAKVFLLNCGDSAYNLVMTYFRAQGALCDYKRLVLRHLRYLMLVSEGRHKAVAKKVYYDSVLQKVAETLNPGLDVDGSWKIESDLSSHSVTEPDRLSVPKDLARFADALNYEQSLHASVLRQSQPGQKRRASDSISDLTKLGIKRKRPCLRNSPIHTAVNALKLRIKKAYEMRKRLPQSGNRLSGSRMKSVPYRDGQTAIGHRTVSSIDGENRLKEHSTSSKKYGEKKLSELPVADTEDFSKSLSTETMHYDECQSSEVENLSGQLAKESGLPEKERLDKSPSSKLDLFDDGCVYNQLFSEHYGKFVSEKRKACSNDRVDKVTAASKSRSSEAGLPTSPKQNNSPRLGRAGVPDFISPIDLLLSSKSDRYRNQGRNANSVRKEIAQVFPKEVNALQMLKNRKLLTSAVQYWESSANSGESNAVIKHEVTYQQTNSPAGSVGWRQNSLIPAGPRILKARAISQPILNGESVNRDLTRNSFNAVVTPYSSKEAKLVVGGSKTRRIILTRRPDSFRNSNGALRTSEKPKISIINRKEDSPASCKVSSFFAADSRINVVRMPVIHRARGRSEKCPSAPSGMQASSVRQPGHTLVCSKSSSTTSMGHSLVSDRFQSTGAAKAYYLAPQRPTTSSDSQASTPSPSSRTFSLVRPVAGTQPLKPEKGSTYRLLPTSTEGKTYKVRLQVNPANGEKPKATPPSVANNDNCTSQASRCPTGVRLIGNSASKRLPGVKVAFRERRNEACFSSRTSTSSVE